MKKKEICFLSFLLLITYCKPKVEVKIRRKISKSNPREKYMTETPIEKQNIGVEFNAGPGVEIRKPDEMRNKGKKLSFAIYRDPNIVPLPTSLTYPSSSEINEYAQGTTMTAEDLMTVNPVKFLPFKISDEGSIGSVDVEPSKNLINQENNEKLIQSERRFQDFYKEYYQNYYQSLEKLYNGSNTSTISDPKLKKVYKYAPLMYTLNYENNLLTNNKAQLKYSPIKANGNPCPCDKNIETCNCENLLENDTKEDENLMPFVPIWQPTIKQRDCKETVEDCSCDEQECKPSDINCLSKIKCQCGCNKREELRKQNSTDQKNSTNSSETNSTQNSTNNSNMTKNGIGFSFVKANINNANALSNSNNLNKIGTLRTNSYETHHSVQHINNYFYGQNFKEKSSKFIRFHDQNSKH